MLQVKKKLHPEEKEHESPLNAGKIKTYLSVQVREGNLRFCDILIYEHVKGCAQLCSGYF